MGYYDEEDGIVHKKKTKCTDCNLFFFSFVLECPYCKTKTVFVEGAEKEYDKEQIKTAIFITLSGVFFIVLFLFAFKIF